MAATPETPHRESNWLFWALALALLLVGIELGRNYYAGALSIRVEGNLSPQEREQLDAVLDPYVRTSTFWLDPEDVAKEVGSLPWVGAVEILPTGLSKATVRISHSLTERLSRPERTLVNTLHDLARASDLPLYLTREALRLDAQDGAQPTHREFVFLTFDVMLAELGIRLDEVEIQANSHIVLHMDSGKSLVLGSHQPLARMHRFARIYRESLGSQWERVGRIDARYRDAVAVRMTSASQLVAGNLALVRGEGL